MRFRILFLLLLVKPLVLWAQQVTLYGYIRSGATNEPIPFAYCVDSAGNSYVYSNESGYFSLMCNKNHRIKFGYLGYEPYYHSADRDSFITIHLKIKEIEEVKIYRREKLYLQTLMGKTNISLASLTSAPTFVGLPDVIKHLSYLPGVVSGKEGFSNLYVRGGGRDQNLVLIDGVPLFSYNHAGGLVSSINVDGIQNIDFYKGGYPARFGNLTSSVLDMRMKEGNACQRKYKLTIGTLTSSFFTEGYMLNKTTTYALAIRTTYFDLLNLPKYIKYLDTVAYNAALSETDGVSYKSYNAFDINLKVVHNLSSRNKLIMNFFSSHDYYADVTKRIYKTYNGGYVDAEYDFKQGFQQANYLSTIGIKSLIKDRVFLSNYVSFSHYSNRFYRQSYEREIDTLQRKQSEFSTISYFSYKSEIDYYPIEWDNLKIGFELANYRVLPYTKSDYRFQHTTNVDTVVTMRINSAYHPVLFVENEIKASTTLAVNVGIRMDVFSNGPTRYYALEPRLSVKKMVSPQSSVKASYTYNKQYLYSVLHSFLGLQKEIWLLADSNIRPVEAHQWSLGYFGIYHDFEFSVETFYKRLSNLIDFKPANVLSQNTVVASDKIYTNGIGESYGFETQLSKDFGNISSSLSYTLAWSNRRFPEINQNQWFPFIYDNRHVVNFSFHTPIDQFWSADLSFVYMSGQPFSLPVGRFEGNSYFEPYWIYASINNYRLPPYHRLDLTFKRRWMSKKKHNKTLKLNIYNVYNRKNPAFATAGDGTVNIYSIYGIIPTVSYEIEF